MFHLSLNNRDQPDEVLLDDLRAVTVKIGKARLTRQDYSAHGRFAAATVSNRFGGWGRALERAGLASSRHFSVSREEAVADLQRVAGILGVKDISLASYRAHGKFSEKPYLNHFGSWIGALSAAGLALSENYNPRISDEALFENLELTWQRLGRQPTVNDMHPPNSAHSVDVYKRRFGGWRKALEAFVSASATEGEAHVSAAVPGSADASGVAVPERARGRSRSVGWRLRYTVLRRDRFACRACGRSPAIHPGVLLEVDHVVPWSKGGLTVEPNLQTLCEQCNGGKGAI